MFFVLSVFDGRYSQILLQLVSRDDWTVDLDKIVSDHYLYDSMAFLNSRSGRLLLEFWEKHGLSSTIFKEKSKLIPSCLVERAIMIGSFLDHQSKDDQEAQNLAKEKPKLIPYCSLERAIMISSFYVHQSKNDQARNFAKETMTQSLTLLLKCGHRKCGRCSRGTLDGSDKSSELNSLPLYSPTTIARQLGVLEPWREALVRSGHDASEIIDESLYVGLIDLFDGLSYHYSKIDENVVVQEEGDEDSYGSEDSYDDDDNHSQKQGLLGKAARTALTFVSSIV